MLNKFPLSRYKLTLAAKENLHLPEYSGSTLRGGFGHTFRKIVCVNRDNECSGCLLRTKCIYSYIFETSPSVDADKLRKYKDIPRPFIIEPPIESKQTYLKGETLEFNLILIGKAICYLPYFIFTFKELGNIGIGRGRGKYELISLTAIKENIEEEIYSSATGLAKNIDGQLTMADVLNEVKDYQQDELTLKFITPTRLKHNGRYILIPEFHILIRSLLSRISSLAYFHCDEELNVDYRQLIEEAKEVKIKERHTGWYDWERYSSRQETRMNLGGIIGNITYTGNLSPFLPFIILGKYAHIGKGATFGLGRYEISKK
ncbi:MAG: CRISPR system precrRNA processing endoribonuclease RAMP protein Cas6 [Candidatus Desantisbacteria bacterium]